MWHRSQAKQQILDEEQRTRPQVRRPWIWRLAALLAVLVIIAIVVPIAVVMTRRSQPAALTPKANVLVPLYVYPAPNAWDPLYNAANASASLNFTVVVNPSSGPGTDALPDDNYIAAISKLRSFPNVKLLGYVPLGYGKNDINTVRQQVQTYSSWASNRSSLAIDGIFYDESPHVFSDDIASYLGRTRDAISGAAGIKDKTTVFNSGVVPEKGLYTAKTDIIIAFEESYNTFQTLKSNLTSLDYTREQIGIIVHSVPTNASMKELVDNMDKYGNNVFATDLTVHANGNPYEAFGSLWTTLIANMPK